MDREKVINGLCDAIGIIHGYVQKRYWGYGEQACRDAISMLKEQEGKPLRCKTCTMRDKTGFCHRWNREVKEDDYCSFGAWKGC